MDKYRIITNEFGTYDVEKRYLFIFWINQKFIGFENIESAENWINDTNKRNKRKKELKKNAGKIIKYL